MCIVGLYQFGCTDEPMPMYVLSNAERLNGAAAVLNSGTMESIAEKLGGDYVVIPSSIHEGATRFAA